MTKKLWRGDIVIIEPPARAIEVAITWTEMRHIDMQWEEIVHHHVAGTEFDLGPVHPWMRLRPHPFLGWSEPDLEKRRDGWKALMKEKKIDEWQKWEDPNICATRIRLMRYARRHPVKTSPRGGIGEKPIHSSG